jgi:hypothetical protein
MSSSRCDWFDKLLRINPAAAADDDGQVRASLAVAKTGAALSLMDGKGKARTKMSVRDDGPHLEFFDADGELISGKP